ncbi:MAG: hypothetical protein H0U69_13360 [Trueperaceae bacterium]|nr:hypothetical protein [Trueperaceae bacterium]
MALNGVASNGVGGAPRGPSAFAIFKNRRFRLMWSAQLISTVGSSLLDLRSAEPDAIASPASTPPADAALEGT